MPWFKYLKRKAHSLLIRLRIAPKRPRPRPPCHIDMGINNEFKKGEDVTLKGSIVVAHGERNLISIGSRTRFSCHTEIKGSGNKLIIGSDCDYRGRILIRGSNQTVTFGSHSTTGSLYMLCQEGCDIEVGAWNMFSRDVEIRTTDSHSLIDRKTGNRVNPAASIRIGDHVWVGLGAVLSKGTEIPDDCVVGARSFVAKAFTESGTVIAGAPAKVMRSGITWNRGRRKRFKEEQLTYWQEPLNPD